MSCSSGHYNRMLCSNGLCKGCRIVTNFVIECRVVRLSMGQVGSGLGLNCTRPDWVTLLETRLIFDRIFGLDLLFQVVGWVGWSCRLSEFGLKFRLILWIGIDFFFFLI